jgi:hypothetical protein
LRHRKANPMSVAETLTPMMVGMAIKMRNRLAAKL